MPSTGSIKKGLSVWLPHKHTSYHDKLDCYLINVNPFKRLAPAPRLCYALPSLTFAI